MNELSIKVGGVYRTRRGRKAVIVAELRGVDKWLGVIARDYVDAAETWAANGMYMQSGDKSGFDLVAEWDETQAAPWSKPEHVPGPVCWIRVAGQVFTCALIVGVDSGGVVNFDPSMNAQDCITKWAAFETIAHEYSTDRVTWKPCIVKDAK